MKSVKSGSSRGWLIFGGLISLVVGVAAITFPVLFSLALVQLLAILLAVTGLVGVWQAIFGDRHVSHRVWTGLSGLIRIAAGVVLYACEISGLAVMTLVLGVAFVAEAIVCLFSALKLKSVNPGWIWLLLNAITALVLGGMLLAKWPNDSTWVVGLLYGIQSLFTGSAMLAVAFSTRNVSDSR
jgi:uncharacterized membrane protein HdeD (DUF308 family)